MPVGTVKFFNVRQGFGFITRDDGEKDVFVHQTAVEASGLTTLAGKERLRFAIEINQQSGPNRGKEMAVNLLLI